MSLLMEALKKAERAKQAQEQGAKAGAPAASERELQLAPAHPEPAALSTGAAAALVAAGEAAEAAPREQAATMPVRDLRQGRADFPKLELESIDDREFDLDPVKPRAPRQAPELNADADARSRAAARTVFEAKLPEAAAPSRMPLVAGTVVVVALLGIGGYFLMQVLSGPGGLVNQQKVGGQLAQRASPPPAPSPAPPTASPAQPMATAPVNSAVAPPAGRESAPGAAPAPVAAQPTALSAPPAAKPADDAEKAEAGAQRPRPAARAPARATPQARIAAVAAGNERGSGAMKVSPPTLTVNPAIDEAYRAYVANDLTTARNRYRAALDSDPGNRDALLGLAAIAARERRPDEAESHYLRILQSNPADAYAQAGLISIRSQGDPVASESRMKTLVASQPDAAFLHYALGNLYARQGRWNEAQQEHFRAFSLEADNPDYCYNLAVSLDQIRQPQLALAHYQRALALAASRTASFDPGQLRARISDLQTQ